MKSHVHHVIESFCKDSVCHLERDDRASLGLLPCFHLSKLFDIGETKAAELAGIIVGKSNTGVEIILHTEWGNPPESAGQQGGYRRSGLLWTNEDLNKKATEFTRGNADVKVQPNLTVAKFVNDNLLPNETLPPGFPCKISVETARKLMHELGFQVVVKKKGIFTDGHEQDVVEYCKTFLRWMVALGFLHEHNAPTEEPKKAGSTW